MYISYHEDYPSKRSTLKLEFHHIDRAREATISVRLDAGSSLAPIGCQGVFTASTASIDDAEVMLLDFREGKLAVAGDGTINLSRRVVSVSDDGNEQLKVSIMALSEEGAERVSTRDDVVFTPKKYVGEVVVCLMSARVRCKSGLHGPFFLVIKLMM
jgi:hypothetical protein